MSSPYVKFKEDFSGFKKNDIVDVGYVFADILINDFGVAKSHPKPK